MTHQRSNKPVVRRSDWGKIAEFGHPIIDEQHRGIVAHTREIMNALRRPQKHPELDEALQHYADEMASHFATEETLMSEIPLSKYAQHIEQHKKTHDEVLGLLHDMVDKIRRGEMDIFIAAGFKNVFELYLKNVADHDAVLMNALHLENLL